MRDYHTTEIKNYLKKEVDEWYRIMKVIPKGKNPIELTKSHFKGSGGQGNIYCRDGFAYKIYHDPKKMIPVDKIRELNKLTVIPSVLAPIDVLLNTNSKPIGFTMKYIDKTDFLCRLFTKSYRNKKNISPQTIADLVKEMQRILVEIHKLGFLVVDYNELNFLTCLDYKIPYHIDVDSYKTPSFPPVAIMESIQDHLAPTNKFSELTDWFSWAVVTFQLYMGTHPYKGRHPDYKDWLKMKQENMSVFHPDVRLPANCQDWSVIPRRHLDWYKAVFHDKERSPDPEHDGYLLDGNPIYACYLC